mgnify:CR=1
MNIEKKWKMAYLFASMNVIVQSSSQNSIGVLSNECPQRKLESQQASAAAG